MVDLLRNPGKAIAAVVLGVSLFLTACSDDGSGTSATTVGAATTAASGSATAKVGVILPDTKSSVRWETADRPFLAEAFKAAGVEYDIQNAEGDKARMATIADQMITDGVTVLLIVNLDSESGAAIEQEGGRRGREDDRLRPPDARRLGAAVYVSFDDVKVGELQGEGLVKCVDATGTRAAGHRRAQRLADRQQRHAVRAGLQLGAASRSRLDGDWTLIGDQSVPDWDNQRAARSSSRCSRPPAARSTASSRPTTASAARRSPSSRRTTCKVPVTGQDATVDGLRNILTGDQCMTVYKPVEGRGRRRCCCRDRAGHRSGAGDDGHREGHRVGP